MSVPGIIPITQASFANGAGNARDSAMQLQMDMNQRQNNLNKAAAGGSMRRRYKGGVNSNSIQVPQFQMPYAPTGGPGTNPNDQVANNAARGMQSNANAVYDNAATIMGGRRRRRRGGKSSRRCKSRKSRNCRRKTMHHRKR